MLINQIIHKIIIIFSKRKLLVHNQLDCQSPNYNHVWCECGIFGRYFHFICRKSNLKRQRVYCCLLLFIVYQFRSTISIMDQTTTDRTMQCHRGVYRFVLQISSLPNMPHPNQAQLLLRSFTNNKIQLNANVN